MHRGAVLVTTLFIHYSPFFSSFGILFKLSMAENSYKSNTFKKPEKEKKGKSGKSGSAFGFFKDPRFHLAGGFFLLITSLFLFTAFVS